MNVSANKIVQHMEEQLTALQKGLNEDDETTVKECAAAIEAYCQLFKGVTGKTQPQQVVEKETIMSLPQEQSNEKLGNLLDF